MPGRNVSLLMSPEVASGAIVRIEIYRLYINAITVPLLTESHRKLTLDVATSSRSPRAQLLTRPTSRQYPAVLHVVGAFFVNIRELFTRRGSQKWQGEERRERGYLGPLLLASIRRLLPVNRKYTILPINLRIRALPIPIRRFVPPAATAARRCVIE